MIDIFRVENSDGNGPYHGFGELQGELTTAHDGDDSHPGPLRDGIYMFDMECHHYDRRFGFTSLDQAFAWFDGWFELMEKHGFRLAQYRVPEEWVIRGWHQAVFNRAVADYVGSV